MGGEKDELKATKMTILPAGGTDRTSVKANLCFFNERFSITEEENLVCQGG